ncbi:carbon-nitrogen hydrolase [Xylaria arbuscula]|nr:carbon-nitrogen hydrolase [Xylaria arbuscula]
MAKAAVGQICSSNSMASNLAQCVKLVGQASSAGAKILFLPEASDYIGTSPQESLSLARPVASSPFVTGLQAAAAQHSIAVHVGIHVPVTVKPTSPTSPSSFSPSSSSASKNPFNSTTPTTPQQQDQSAQEDTITKLYNRTIYITPTGTIHPTGSYDKLHLFDYASLRESASTQAGTDLIAPIASPIGRLGSLICFDLRFPEPALHLTQSPKYQQQQQRQRKAREGEGEGKSESESEGPAQILLYPSAFTVPTGRAHWEVLLRARAIETQSYVIAAAQVGAHNFSPTSTSTSTSTGKKPRVSYGYSTVIDPWGRVLLKMKGVRPDWDSEGDSSSSNSPADAVEDGAIGELVVVDIDLGEWERVREKMPLIRRTDVYPEL